MVARTSGPGGPREPWPLQSFDWRGLAPPKVKRVSFERRVETETPNGSSGHHAWPSVTASERSSGLQ